MTSGLPTVDPVTAFSPALTGLAFGLSLIVAIGAQNAFVLRQGLRREHVGGVVAICIASDVVLIATGVAGLGSLVVGAPALLDVIEVGGAIFLLGYAALALRRAVRPAALAVGDEAGPSRSAVLLTAAYGYAVPVSTTHVLSSSIMGVGATRRLSAVRWGVAGNIATAWVLTIPAAALVAAAVYGILHVILF